MNWTLLFNPFRTIPSKALLLLGLVVFIGFSIFSWLNGVVYDGMLDVHIADDLKPLDYFNANAINVILTVLILHTCALIVNSKTRLVDIFASALIFRIPIYIASLFIKSEAMLSVARKVENLQGSLDQLQFSTSEITSVILISILSLALIAWAIAILFFGYKTACNAKKWWHYALFILAVIVTEIFSKFLIDIIL